MSNSTTPSPVSDTLIDTITDVFLTWIQNDVFPTCTAVLDIVIIIVGLILNIFLMVSFHKRGLYNEASSYIVQMLVIVDFVAYLFLLVPNVITAIAREWILSHPVCEVHGAMIGILMFLQFYFLIFLGIERALKIAKEGSGTHEKLLERRKLLNTLIMCIWVFSFVIGFIPVTGAGDIRYAVFHQGCMLDYKEQHAFLIVHFLLTVVASIIAFLVCYSLIFNTRYKALLTQRKTRSDTNKAMECKQMELYQGTQGTSFDSSSGLMSEKARLRANHQNRRLSRRKRAPDQEALLFEVFKDDAENPAFHLSITYFSVWMVICLCYMPYFVVSFFNTYSNDVWEGFFNITLLVMHMSFVLKPFIYLFHNRHYRHVTKQLVPVAVRNRAVAVRSSVSGLAEKMEDFLFKSTTNKKLSSTLATHKAILVWKRKMKKNTGLFKLKEEGESVENAMFTKTAQGKILNETNGNNINGDVEKGEPADDTKHIPASETTGEMNGATSFIEKERQKMISLGQTPEVSYGTGVVSVVKEPSPLPGQIEPTNTASPQSGTDGRTA